jgi:hypothetical protein
MWCNCCCWLFGVIGSVISVLAVVFISIIFSCVDIGIGTAYVSVAGSDSLHFQTIDLSKVSQDFLTTPLQIGSVALPKAETITIIKNFLEAKAGEAKLFDLIPLDKMLPLKELAGQLGPALKAVIATAKLPKSINDSIQETIDELAKDDNVKQFRKQDSDSLFGPDARNKTQDMLENVITALRTGRCLGDSEIGDLEVYTTANSEFFGSLSSRLSRVNNTLNELPTELRGMVDDVPNKFKEGFNGLVDALMVVLEGVWEPIGKFDVKPVVHVTHLVNNVLVWALPYWASCMSISAHLLIVAQAVLVIELWVRRRNQLPAGRREEEEESERGLVDKGDTDEPESSESWGHDSGDDDEKTVDFRMPVPQGEHLIDSDSRKKDSYTGEHTFVF